MDRMKSYTGIWGINKSMYIGDREFTFRISFLFAGVLAVMYVFMFTVGKYIPLFMLDNPLVRYGVIPIGVAYVMDRKNFEDRRPHHLLVTMMAYLFRCKYTFLGRKGTFGKVKYGGSMTVVNRYSSLEEMND